VKTKEQVIEELKTAYLIAENLAVEAQVFTVESNPGTSIYKNIKTEVESASNVLHTALRKLGVRLAPAEE